MTQGTIQIKQQYLRQKILDTGYDPQKFVQFCSEKHNLDDLQNWSMNQLISIVEQFIQETQNKKSQAQKVKIQITNQVKYNQNMQLLTQPAFNASQNDKGLMLYDVDWNVLLSGPSIIDSSSSSNNNSVPFDFNIELLSPQSNQTESTNLTQKSIKTQETIPQEKTQKNQIKPQSTKLEINQFEDRQADMIKGLTQKNIKSQSKSKSNIPINLSNIKLSSRKEKVFQNNLHISDVVVHKTQQVSRNFLQSDYTLYHIKFLPIQHKIQRKFSDLRKLRFILQKLYPFLRLPYLQPEGWINSSQGKDPQNLIKYKIMVEQFLQYIMVKSQELKNTEIVRIFCGLSERGQLSKEQLKKKLDYYENLPKPKSIKEISLKQNQIIIPPTCHQQQHISNTLFLINEYDIIYQKLRKQLDNLFINYDLLSKSYADIINTFEVLENLIKKYKGNNTQHNNNNEEMKEIRFFEGLRQSTIKFSNKMSEQYTLFRVRIKNFFRYQKDNMHTLKQVIESRNKIHSQYARQGYPSLTSGKHKDGNLEIQSSIPLQQPIKNNKNILSVQQIFWSFMVSRQIDRYWQLLKKKISQHLTTIAYDQLQLQNKNLNFWNMMIKKCVM